MRKGSRVISCRKIQKNIWKILENSLNIFGRLLWLIEEKNFFEELQKSVDISIEKWPDRKSSIKNINKIKRNQKRFHVLDIFAIKQKLFNCKILSIFKSVIKEKGFHKKPFQTLRILKNECQGESQ